MSLDVYLYHPATSEDADDSVVFWANYTHNVGQMAALAGVYNAVWRPDENSITHAHQLIEPLRTGIAWMATHPAECEALNPDNGWGDYDGFSRWLREYLNACIEYPDAAVRVSR